MNISQGVPPINPTALRTLDLAETCSYILAGHHPQLPASFSNRERTGMLSRLFAKRSTRSRLSPQGRALLRLAEFEVTSASCFLLRTSSGVETDEDLGLVHFFKQDGRLMIKDRAVYVTMPDGVKAENQDQFTGGGEVVSLWFLHEHVPRVIECLVEERVRFSTPELSRIDPKSGTGFRLTPLSDIIKQDKRSAIRFSHLRGRARLPVYPQVLFDVFAWKTSLTLPSEGAMPLRIEDMKLEVPPNRDDDVMDEERTLEGLVQRFKEDMLGNPSEERAVHVSKPYLEERHNRSLLLELGYSDVLGLGSEEIGRNLHIKKPMTSRTKDRRDAHFLSVGDTLVLHYGARSSLDGQNSYYELVTEVSKGGLENITIRPQMAIRSEQGVRVPLVDFSVNGVRIDATQELVGYLLGKDGAHLTLEGKLDSLKSKVMLFHFYPRLRFSRDTEIYRPELPKRIAVLGNVVRGDIEWEDERERKGGRLKSLGVKFMYDPVEYSRDRYLFDRWEMIRPFKENRYFKTVHKSLNGLIAYLESQTKD